MVATKSAIAFFYEWAGWSYNPATETPTQGRMSGAKALARAESWASSRGYSFVWEHDGMDSSEWCDDPDPWPTWKCVCFAPDGVVASCLFGIDFGRDGEPWGDNYRRVVEAELAMEAPGDGLQEQHAPDAFAD